MSDLQVEEGGSVLTGVGCLRETLINVLVSPLGALTFGEMCPPKFFFRWLSSVESSLSGSDRLGDPDKGSSVGRVVLVSTESGVGSREIEDRPGD